MANNDVTPVIFERATEQLRQERELFNQRKVQEERWFYLRLVMGYSSVVLLTVVMIIASYILLYSATFSGTVVTAAGGALFVDVLGLLIGVWKIALNPDATGRLEPVTIVSLPDANDVLDINGDESAIDAQQPVSRTGDSHDG